jgi:hypothetical protein
VKHGDRGEAVKTLQLNLIMLGYSLPRFGADGGLGGETLDAFARFMRDHAPEVDPDPAVISDMELHLVERVLAMQEEIPDFIVDRRQHATREHDYGVRPWTKVLGATLHQTACDMGEGLDRYNGIGAHIVVLRSGRALWMHEFTRLIGHGGSKNPPHAGWNPGCLGIEFNGLYAGKKGDPSTVWNDPSTARREVAMLVTPEAMETGRNVVRWAKRRVEAHGGRFFGLNSHRQASPTRDSDPGQEIYQEVILPLHAELEMTDGGPGFTVGYGKPIPEAWNPAYKGIKY